MKAEEVKIIKKASVEINGNKKSFHLKAFFGHLWPWLLSGLLSLFPSIVLVIMLFIDGSGENFRFWANIEIIYVCVTLSVIMIFDNFTFMRMNLMNPMNFFVLSISLLAVVLGSAIYGFLRYNEYKGIATSDLTNLTTVNLCFLSFVVIIGLINYVLLSFKNEVS
jgi:hypothetical protein